MFNKIKKIKNYKFVANKYNEKGIGALILGFISLVMLIILVIVSYMNSGEAGVNVGTLGLWAVIFAVAGFVLGLISFGEKDREYGFSKIGTLFSFFVTVLWVIIIVLGSI